MVAAMARETKREREGEREREGGGRQGIGIVERVCEPPWRSRDGADGTRMAGWQCEKAELGKCYEGDASAHQSGAAPSAALVVQLGLPGADSGEVRWRLHLGYFSSWQNQVRNREFFRQPDLASDLNVCVELFAFSAVLFLSLDLVSVRPPVVVEEGYFYVE